MECESPPDGWAAKQGSDLVIPEGDVARVCEGEPQRRGWNKINTEFELRSGLCEQTSLTVHLQTRPEAKQLATFEITAPPAVAVEEGKRLQNNEWDRERLQRIYDVYGRDDAELRQFLNDCRLFMGDDEVEVVREQLEETIRKKMLRPRIASALVDAFSEEESEELLDQDRLRENLESIPRTAINEWSLSKTPSVTEPLVKERERRQQSRLSRPRQQVFRDKVLDAYGNACAFCGWDTRHPENGQPLVVAAHIRPVSDDGSNAVSNGLALCPNCHRLFDEGIVALTEECQIEVHEDVDDSTRMEISEFEGEQIRLPKEEAQQPEREQIRWHREKQGF